jgi:hypothetical protein
VGKVYLKHQPSEVEEVAEYLGPSALWKGILRLLRLQLGGLTPLLVAQKVYNHPVGLPGEEESFLKPTSHMGRKAATEYSD